MVDIEDLRESTRAVCPSGGNGEGMQARVCAVVVTTHVHRDGRDWKSAGTDARHVLHRGNNSQVKLR